MTVTGAAVAALRAGHRDRFRTVSFVQLRSADVASQVQVTEDEIKRVALANGFVTLRKAGIRKILDGVELPVRANIGIHTQPISFIGLPVVAAPVPLEPMPIGVQIIAAPWREDIALRVAAALEKMGVVAAPPPRGI